MTFDEKAMRPRVLKRAEAIGLSAACRDGISQTLFYWSGAPPPRVQAVESVPLKAVLPPVKQGL